jgi:geranylgeranyl pyrophosphate synthase
MKSEPDIFGKDASIDVSLPGHRKLKRGIDEQLCLFVRRAETIGLGEIVRTALFPGRRLRPTLLYSLCRTSPKLMDDVDHLACAVELAHRASIITDDMLDRDNMRRQTAAFHVKYGRDVTVLAAHWLVSQAFTEISRLSDRLKSSALPAFVEGYERMVIGQMADIAMLEPRGDYLTTYSEVALYKTSALFEFIFKMAAHIKEMSVEQGEVLRTVGNSMGVLYQIYNDVYDDVVSSFAERGVRSRWKVTLSLAISFLLDNADSSDRKFVLSCLGRDCSHEIHQQLQSKFTEYRYMDFAIKHTEQIWSEAAPVFDDIEDRQTRQMVWQFSSWLKQRRCWDQTQVYHAGY